MAVSGSRRHQMSIGLAVIAIFAVSLIYLRSPAPHSAAGQSAQRPTLQSAQFYSADVGWLLLHDAVNGAGELVTTSNAGRSWRRVALPPGASADVLGFQVIDRDYATLQLGHGLTVTDDDGATWRHIALPGRGSPGTAVYTTDRLHGWYLNVDRTDGVARPASMWATRDGGVTWSLLFSAAAADMTRHGVPVDGEKVLLGFTTPSDGWLDVVTVATSRLLVTHDGGTTWARVRLPVEAPAVAIHASPGGDVFLLQAGAPGYVVTISSDGGANWSEARHVPVSGLSFGGLTQPAFIDANTWLLPDGRHIVVTHDGGLSWSTTQSQLPAGLQLEYLPLIGPTGNGFAVARDGLDNPYLLATGDGGRHWAQLSVPQLA